MEFPRDRAVAGAGPGPLGAAFRGTPFRSGLSAFRDSETLRGGTMDPRFEQCVQAARRFRFAVGSSVPWKRRAQAAPPPASCSLGEGD